MTEMTVNGGWRAFASAFRNEEQVALDRALAELRAGRPILMDNAGQITMLSAVDAMSSAVLRAIVRDHQAHFFLGLPQARAQAIGLRSDGAVSLPLAGVDGDAILRLAGDLDIETPKAWSLADETTLIGIELCKRALLLPAVLSARASRAISLPLHCMTLEQARSALNGDSPDPEIVARTPIELTGNTEANFVVFRGGSASRDHIAVIVGDPPRGRPVTVRMHSACLTGDLLGSLRCDCGDQLRASVARFASAGGGILLYLDQEGRGAGIRNKIRAYALQDRGLDTIDADATLGYGIDERRYEFAAKMLRVLGYCNVRLLTNNPDKVAALRRAGIRVEERQPLTGLVTTKNHFYLSTKANRAGHLLSDLLEPVSPAENSGDRR